AICVAYHEFLLNRFSFVDCSLGSFEQTPVEHLLQFEILFDLLEHADVVARRLAMQNRRQIEFFQFPMIEVLTDAEHICSSYHLVDCAEAQLRHYFPKVLGEEVEEVNDVIRTAGKQITECGILRRDPHRARIKMALTHHD